MDNFYIQGAEDGLSLESKMVKDYLNSYTNAVKHFHRRMSK